MTTLANWFSPSTMHSLGWTLLHFLWQGTAVAALAAVTVALFRRASVRYAIAVAALVLMLAAPIATFIFLSASTGEIPKTAASILAETSRSGNSAIPLSSSLSKTSGFAPSLDRSPWLVEAWLLGVAFFSLRSAGGFLLLECERRKQSDTVSARVLATCHSLQRRLGLNRAIRYCECEWLQAPAVIGWFRPIVFLPVTALTGLSEEQLRLIIVHELAHIQRLDPFVNVFQISVETLLFYHPAVWWLNKRIRDEREHCCDDVAIALCGNPLEYARALTLMEEWRSAPTLAMAANRGPLSARIFRVLGMKSAGNGTRGMGLGGGLLCLAAALVAGNALIRIAYPKPVAHANEISLARIAPAQFAWALTQQPSDTPSQAATPSTKPAANSKPSAARATVDEQPSSGGSYVDGMKAAGLTDLTVDQLISMKIQGVTPEYVRGLHEQGLRPTADNLISMRVQGVTPDYVRDIRGMGLSPTEEQLVSMRIQGVTADYVRELKENGVLEPNVDQLVSLRIQGVTPGFVRGLREQGLQPTTDDLISMRIQGVTPEYVREIHALDLKPTTDQLVSMRIQGVTPEYVQGLKSAGLKLDIDELIDARIQGITPEFLERAHKHGFQNVPLDKLIHMRQMGILESPAEM